MGADVRAGRLVPVLEKFDPGEQEAIHARYPDRGGHLPGRLRAFLDFLVEHVKLVA